MELNKLPFDNLYKFIALLGAVIFLTSFIYPLIELQQVKLSSLEIEKELEILTIESSNLLKRTQLLEKEIGTSPQRTQLPGYITKLNELLKSKEDFEINKVTINSKISTNNYLKDQSKKFVSLCILGVPFGVLFSSFGFFLWYWKLQYHQDSIIQANSGKEIKFTVLRFRYFLVLCLILLFAIFLAEKITY